MTESTNDRSKGMNEAKADSESQRLARLQAFREPIIAEVMAENPGLSKEQLVQMMDEMGF